MIAHREPVGVQDARTTSEEGPTRQLQPAQLLLEELLRRSLVIAEDWQGVPATLREQLRQQTDSDELLLQLVAHHLLTSFQADQVRAGRTASLIVGNYRLLERLGAGGMGVVFKAEHLLLRRLVALKLLPNPFEDNLEPLQRFMTEIRNVASLQHPNIVAAIDAGQTRGPDIGTGSVYYLVMEYLPGTDLHQHVCRHGPLPLARACDLICQVASALAEAHQHNLIHRDVKPSNVLVTPEGQAKLLDFGLAVQAQRRRLTQPGVVLGSVEYMAPEQASGGKPIDHRADLYALGGVLCWCLTGENPFPPCETLAQELVARQTQPPPSLRAHRPDLPVELDTVLSRMMAVRAEDRYPTARAIINALLPFLERGSRITSRGATPPLAEYRAALPLPETGSEVTHRALVVDDDPTVRRLSRRLLEKSGLNCDEAEDGTQALAAVQAQRCDLVLLDVNLPGIPGPEVLRRLREQASTSNMKIVMYSAEMSPDEMATLLAAGADDYLVKPASAAQLLSRVKALLALRDAQERSDLLTRHLLAVNAELEHSLRAHAGDMVQARDALVLTLAELAEARTGRGPGRLLRLQRYCRCLGEASAGLPAFNGQLDAQFITMLECCAPLHDIGLVTLPEHVLQNPGKFDRDERLVMQTHTTAGAELLQRNARRHSSALAFLQMASDIARHHHERWDGSGYPDRLAGTAIPLAARILAVGDVYDALRSRRLHRPALSHVFAVEIMTEGSPGHFDPHLVQVFRGCAARFERIFRDTADSTLGG